MNTGATNHISNDIKQGKIKVLWSEFPIKGHSVKLDRFFAHMSQLGIWARLCSDNGVDFMLVGSFGPKWNDAQIETMIADGLLSTSYHRMCHFNLKVDSSQKEPSGSCFVIAANFLVKSHPCICNVSREEHVLDWKTRPSSSQSRLKSKALFAMMEKMLHELEGRVGSRRSTPDSLDIGNSEVLKGHLRATTLDVPFRPATQTAFPTEGRERQKIMQKARKLAGGEATKKKFDIE